MVKRIVRRGLRFLGYDVVPMQVLKAMGEASSARLLPTSDIYRKALAALEYNSTMREIHRHDVVEIEELYRHFVFPSLPQDPRRSGLLHELIGTTVSEAIYLINYLHEALKISGDICEFGVAQGATSRLIASEIMSTDRKFWLFDSFEGLPAPGPEDKLIHDIFKLGTMSRYQGTMAYPENEVLAKLKMVGFPVERTKVKKGWVSDTTKGDDLPAQVAFAYVDFDFYDPIKCALEFLDRRMLPGGSIVVDDYGFFSEGAQLAVDQFVSQAGSRFKFQLPLPFAGHFCILNKVE